MIPALLGLGAWVAKGAVLLAIPRLVKALNSSSSPPPSVPCPSRTPLATVSALLPQVSEPETRLARVFSVDGQGCIIRTYHAQGDVVSHFNGAGFSTTYQFDSMHRIPRMTHPGTGGSEIFGYDAKGRLESWRKTDNSVVSYDYDVLDRISKINYQGTEKVRHTYDPLGRVTRMDDQVGPTRYRYSPGSDLLRVEDGLNRALVYTYDPANQLLTRNDPQNVVTQFIHKARGQVSQAIHDGLTANYQYNALGAPTQVSWNNGLSEHYQYSTQGEAMRRTVTFPGRTLESEAVERDALGRKSQAVFTLPGSQRSHAYTYNLIGQLTGSTRRLQPTGSPQTSQTYGYDDADNRTRNGLQTSAFNPADQITSITATTCAWRSESTASPLNTSGMAPRSLRNSTATAAPKPPTFWAPPYARKIRVP